MLKHKQYFVKALIHLYILSIIFFSIVFHFTLCTGEIKVAACRLYRKIEVFMVKVSGFLVICVIIIICIFRIKDIFSFSSYLLKFIV